MIDQMPQVRRFRCAAGIAASLITFHAAAAEAAWMEDFSGTTDGTALESLSGWSSDAGTQSLITGEQIIAASGSQYTRILSASEMITASSGATFTMTWRDTHTSWDGFHFTELRLGQSGGAHAFVIQIDGGEDDDLSTGHPGNWDNTRDNSFHISSGGTDVDNATFTDYLTGVSNYNSPWIREVTYTLELTNIDLAAGTATIDIYTSQTWTGSSVFGTHHIDNQTITATGGGFSLIDTFAFVRGTGHPGSDYSFDNFTLTPEPASAALLGMGGLLIGRRRRG